MEKKLISVLMCVFNENPAIVKKAINSILNQTHKLWELIIINDSGYDADFHFIKDEFGSDARIKMYHNDSNIGLTASLNKGIELAKGEYIARMDADDYSLSNRFEIQLKGFERYPHIAIIGGGAISFGDNIDIISPLNLMHPDRVKVNLLFSSTLCHPTVMIKAQILKEKNLYYDECFNKAQDYDLWSRAAHVVDLMVLDDIVLLYRVHNMQITANYKGEQIKYADEIMMRNLSYLGYKACSETLVIMKAIKGIGECDFNIIKEFVKDLKQKNEKVKIFDETEFNNLLNYKMTAYIFRQLFRKGVVINIKFVNIRSCIDLFMDRLKRKILITKYIRKFRSELKRASIDE